MVVWRETFEGATALLQSVPKWVCETRNEKGGEEFRNLQQVDFVSWAHDTKLTLVESGKELMIWFEFFLKYL